MKNNLLIINGRKISFFILYFTLIMETLIFEFNFPDWIRYFNDLALIISVFLMKFKFIKTFKENKNMLVIGGIGIFIVASLLSAVINLVPIRLVFWATRNTFRGIIFFIVAVQYFKNEELDDIFNDLAKIQFINLLLALYQCFILNHTMDYIGGIFGYGNGAGVNIFNSLLIAYYLNKYLNTKEGLSKLIFVLLSSFVIAAVAEEKMTYIFFVVVFIISIVLSKFSLKKVAAVIICIIGLIAGMSFLKAYSPEIYEIMTNYDILVEYSTASYDEGYKLPRIGSFKVIENLFLNTNFEKIFGLGFGNCDTSSIKLFQSEFYRTYGHYNYRWFTHQWTFLESGYIGIVSLILMFIMIIISLLRKLKASTEKNKVYLVTSLCTTICCIITIWYNATLKVDMSYLAYFSVAIGFIATKRENKEKIYKEISTSLGGENDT